MSQHRYLSSVFGSLLFLVLKFEKCCAEKAASSNLYWWQMSDQGTTISPVLQTYISSVKFLKLKGIFTHPLCLLVQQSASSTLEKGESVSSKDLKWIVVMNPWLWPELKSVAVVLQRFYKTSGQLSRMIYKDGVLSLKDKTAWRTIPFAVCAAEQKASHHSVESDFKLELSRDPVYKQHRVSEPFLYGQLCDLFTSNVCDSTSKKTCSSRTLCDALQPGQRHAVHVTHKHTHSQRQCPRDLGLTHPVTLEDHGINAELRNNKGSM